MLREMVLITYHQKIYLYNAPKLVLYGNCIVTENSNLTGSSKLSLIMHVSLNATEGRKIVNIPGEKRIIVSLPDR